jgi:hypothetical protein
LQELKKSRPTDELLVSKITQVLAKQSEPLKNKPSEAAFISMLHKHPDDLQVPEALLHKLYEKETAGDWNWKYLKNMHIVATDLDGDNLTEYACFDLRERWSSADLWYQENDDWKTLQLNGVSQLSADYIEQRLVAHPAESVSPKWKRLKIGDLILGVYENDR